MPKRFTPDLSLFLDIVQKLEAIGIPYVIIGGFAATIYGINRATFDIDIIVDLVEEHILALSDAYPLPRFYADPHQMRNAVQIGSSFNIIDVERGEKADLFPLTMDVRYRPAFENRVRQVIQLPGSETFPIWAARPEDVIFGKLMAWAELHTKRHESDIYEMMVFHYLGAQPDIEPAFDEKYVDNLAKQLGEEVAALWQATKVAAQQEAKRSRQ